MKSKVKSKKYTRKQPKKLRNVLALQRQSSFSPCDIIQFSLSSLNQHSYDSPVIRKNSIFLLTLQVNFHLLRKFLLECTQRNASLLHSQNKQLINFLLFLFIQLWNGKYNSCGENAKCKKVNAGCNIRDQPANDHCLQRCNSILNEE